MNNKVFYTPGTFGNYVAFLIDSKNKGSLDHDPFTQSGSSHNRNVETKSYDIVLYESHKPFKECTSDDIGIYWSNEYFFYILHSSFGRTNHGQFGECGVKFLQQNTWQWIKSHKEFEKAGSDISSFVKDLEQLYGFKCNEENQIVPKNILRQYYFFQFVNYFKNKIFVKNNEIKENAVLKKLSIETILDYKKIKEFLDIPFDFTSIHQKFIDTNLSLVAHKTQQEIVDAVKQNKNLVIGDLDVVTEAGIFFDLEKHYFDIPFHNLGFTFTNTREIIDYVKHYPQYMKKPNNLFVKYYKVYNGN